LKIEIDKESGFCYGVREAVSRAEEGVKKSRNFYCLGDIVHNSAEINRLEKLGLKNLSHEELDSLKEGQVLIRAHGEPPETYLAARENNLEIVDATCPIVLGLQKKIKSAVEKVNESGGSIVIYGKNGHPEVKGLVGQTGNNAVVMENTADAETKDLAFPVFLFAQTTKDPREYTRVQEILKKRLAKVNLPIDDNLKVTNSICNRVKNRVPHLKEFVKKKDLAIFVAGKKSSNGKILYEHCKEANPNTRFISSYEEVQQEWFTGIEKVGICGATSTPFWQLEEVAGKIKKF
jgi:4-hydroxy-3-methylbut-2-enyl diphosphate reductase